MERQRQIITVRPASIIRTGNRWPASVSAVWLDESSPDECTQNWGTLQTKQSVWEKPMTVAGRKFDRGLGTHANGRIMYELDGGQWKTFRAVIGRDEHAGDGRIVFEVWLDGKRLFESGPMTKESAAQPVELDVSGGKILELRTHDGGDGISGDHGNWADAQLVR
jgi:beta-galactosidase